MNLPKELHDFLPDRNDLSKCIEKPDVIPDCYLELLNRCMDKCYSNDCLNCITLCQPLLDYTWEKLNTGYWKDVDINWRYVYSIVSLMKAFSEAALLLGDSSVQFKTFMKTCDMGLLMGAPIHDNILTKLVSLVQKIVSTETYTRNSETKKHPIEETDERMKKKIRLDFHQVSIDKNKEIPRCEFPSLITFQEKFMSEKVPIIVTGAMSHWPARSSRPWSVDYIKEIAGSRTVPIEIGSKYTDDSWTQKLMTVGDFIDKYILKADDLSPVGYLAQHQLFDQVPELKRDFLVPDYCYVGESDDVDINAWFGPMGTVSPLHFDPKHNFLAQVVGRKYIRLYSDSETKNLYPHPSMLLQSTSRVDLENPDLDSFPLFKSATYTECILEEGEMLYIPPKFWHFVKSLSVSFSVSFWWQ